MVDLKGLAQAAVTNANKVVDEVILGDPVMAEGHAILLAQQAEEIVALLAAQNAPNRAPEGATS